MEKFSKFSDPKSGVNPFLPEWSNYRSDSHLIIRCFSDVGFAALAVLKLIVTFTISCVLVVMCCVFWALGWIGLGAVAHLVLMPLWRMLMAAVGFLTIDEIVVENRRLKISDANGSARDTSSLGNAISQSQLLLCNFTNINELIYLHMKTGTNYFLIPVKQSQRLVFLHFWDALGFAAQFRMFDDATLTTGSLVFPTLSDAYAHSLKYNFGPVVVLPEGMKSNGIGLLSWTHFKSLSKTANCQNLLATKSQLVGFHYPNLANQSYGPPHTCGAGWLHLWRLLQQPRLAMRVVWTSQQQVSSTLKTLSPQDSVVDHLREVTRRMLPGCRLLDVDASMLAHFQQQHDQQHTKTS